MIAINNGNKTRIKCRFVNFIFSPLVFDWSNVIKNFIKKVVFMKKENNYFPIFTKKKRIS
ncbi:hypothetical protein CUZ91_0537 [Enterococcus xinjiangensis]|nr:hypothetical protein [Enterococcus lactis]